MGDGNICKIHFCFLLYIPNFLQILQLEVWLEHASHIYSYYTAKFLRYDETLRALYFYWLQRIKIKDLGNRAL